MPRRGHDTNAAIRMTRVGTKSAAPRVGHGGMGLHLAPLSAKGGGTSTSGAAAFGDGLVDNDASCRDENGPPNNVSNEEQGRDEEKVSL
jgi:hypothetical protein